MYKLQLGVIEELYNDLDSAMIDCFSIFPNASFSLWQESQITTWLDVIDENFFVGKIFEVN
ncbi:MAG: hypothetical protein WC929_05780 [Bacilli bacterium]|jgi:hypothetical protein|nr:hypothetical protein [Candidatus Nanoarchaeia archaeon]